MPILSSERIVAVNACECRMDIAEMSLRRLRKAIHNNQVFFPSPTPKFEREPRAEMQWRVVDLYFVRSWSCERLAERYGVTRAWIGLLLAAWVQRAIASGYLGKIPAAEAAAGEPGEVTVTIAGASYDPPQ
jgi:hypothetical protein